MRHPRFTLSRTSLVIPVVCAVLATGGGAVAQAAAPAHTRTVTGKPAITHPAPKKSAPKKTAPKKTTTTKTVRTSPVRLPVTRPQATAAVFTSRVGTRSTPFTDAAGRTWGPLPATLGTRHRSTRLSGQSVARTTNPAPYQTNAWGARGYLLPVPARDTYTVHLLMAEDTFAKAGQRVFDVKAEGRTVAAGVDIAKAVGRGAAYDVSFPVTVTDGELTLEFVKRVDEPLVSAIEVTGRTALPTTAMAALQQPTQAVRFAPGNIFSTRVDSAPLAPNSARTSALVAAQVRDNWGGVAAVNAYSFNVGFHVVPPGTKRITVGYFNCQHKQGVPAGLFDGDKHFVSVPVPAGAKPAVGTDNEMTIYDPAADQMWDLWEMRRNATTGAWEACWGGRMDHVSQQTRPVFPQYYGTAASGLSLAGGMVTVADVERGRIDHAVSITVIDAARWDRLSWPASRSDGRSNDPDAIREGQRLRLDPRLDLDTLDLTPFGRLVAQAAQKYGFIVVDKAGAVAVQTEFGLQKKLFGSDPWDTLLGGPSYSAMTGFPWDRIQALPVDYGKP